MTNHVAPAMVIDHLENQLTCWIQNKRLFKDLVKINLHEGTKLRYPQIIQVYLSTQLPPLNCLPSNVVIEGVNVPNPPTQATKSKKISKFGSKITSSVSQKTPTVKTTKSQPEGSAHVSNKGEGTGNNQMTQKNKVGEDESKQPCHVVSSQYDTIINKDSNTSLSTSSQKGVDIEKSSQRRARNIEGDTRLIKYYTLCQKEESRKINYAHMGSTHWLNSRL